MSLIVDDSAMIRAMVAGRCGSSGAGDFDSIFEAGNGNEALTLLASVKIDLVLSDVHMPEMGGAELIARMREGRLADIPVVVISAEPSLERMEELCRLGAKGYLRKPFTPENIRTLIMPLLEKKHENN